MSAIDNLTDLLSSAKVTDRYGDKLVSFVGQSLSLDTEEDAAEIVQAIQNCPGMTTLQLEGNTLGTPAAKAIAKALESQPDFKIALWKDMFTRRDKTEIPKALSFLSSGIMLAKAQLVVLDLSDNAFGPRGLIGLKELLQSSSCFTLQELYLNNNGLGISGATMLSEALCKCVENSKLHGKPMSLEIFVCGRNRLENDGAIAIAKFLKQLGTLKSVAMPQNGIYAPGIQQLSDAFTANPTLEVINMNDNTLTEEGAGYIADCLSYLPEIELLNLGDCLVRTEGAKTLATSLQKNCPKLRELNLGFNEIDKEGGLAIVDAMESKQLLQTLILNGNQFGPDGCTQIEDRMSEIEKYEMLASLSEDEGDDDDDEDEEDYDEDHIEEEEDDETDSQGEDDVSESVEEKKAKQKYFQSPMTKNATPVEFAGNPTAEALISLHKNNQDLISVLSGTPKPRDYMNLFCKIVSVVKPDDDQVKAAACKFADEALSKAISASENEHMFNNLFLEYIGLIKGEQKRFKKGHDITGTLLVLEHAVKQPYFPSDLRITLQFFLSRPLLVTTASEKAKHLLLQTLYQI